MSIHTQAATARQADSKDFFWIGSIAKTYGIFGIVAGEYHSIVFYGTVFSKIFIGTFLLLFIKNS